MSVRERSQDKGGRGSRVIRGRGLEDRWGLPSNTSWEQLLCDGDSALWLKMLWLTVLAKHGNPDLEATIEQPQDPEEWQPANKPRPERGYPTFPDGQKLSKPQNKPNCDRLRMDQGRMGHPRRKPTTLLSSSPEIHELDGLRLQGVSSSWSPDLQHRLEEAKVAAEWGSWPVRRADVGPRAQRLGALPPWPEALRGQQCLEQEDFVQRRRLLQRCGRHTIMLATFPSEEIVLSAWRPQAVTAQEKQW